MIKKHYIDLLKIMPIVVLLLFGCNNNNGGSSNQVTLEATLSGGQEVPAVITNASGSATVTINLSLKEITYSVQLSSGFSSAITQAHIHSGEAGLNGPINLFLCTDLGNAPAGVPAPQACPDSPGTLSGTLTASDFIAAGSITTFDELISDLQNGNAYINVHTVNNAGGEIRGQAGPAELRTALSGDQEVPAVTTTASGTATVTFNSAQNQITYSVQLSDGFSSAITQAHIHSGEAGVNGPINLFLCTDLGNAPAGVPTPQACPDFPGTISGTLDADDFIAAGGINTFNELAEALLSGNAYINVHTVNNAGGEIRGQLGAAQLQTTLSGDQEVPAVTTAAGGSAFVRFSATQTVLTYSVEVGVGFSSAITQSHIHSGEAGVNGPINLFLCTDLGNAPAGVPIPQACPDSPGTIAGTLTEADFIAAGGVNSFNELAGPLLSGNAYINVHTVNNAGGEIRGQLGAAQLQTTLSGNQEVPPVTTAAGGSAFVRLSATQSVITYSVAVSGVFSSDITQSHIHSGEEGANGPINLFLCTNLGNAPAGVPTPQGCPDSPDTIAGTLDEDDFIAAGVINFFDELIDAIISGGTYINVHSVNNTGGEIRGQLGAAELQAALNGNQEVPPVTTAASGSGFVRLSGTQTVVSYSVAVSGVFSSDITQAHIHSGAVGVNGPIHLFLCTDLGNAPVDVPTPQGCPDSPDTIAGTLDEDDFIAAGGIDSLEELTDAIISGSSYINVHSVNNAGGEIRGQLSP